MSYTLLPAPDSKKLSTLPGSRTRMPQLNFVSPFFEEGYLVHITDSSLAFEPSCLYDIE